MEIIKKLSSFFLNFEIFKKFTCFCRIRNFTTLDRIILNDDESSVGFNFADFGEMFFEPGEYEYYHHEEMHHEEEKHQKEEEEIEYEEEINYDYQPEYEMLFDVFQPNMPEYEVQEEIEEHFEIKGNIF